jgi:flavin reductase (DIM6/NTAB) family NADH-FMN oxidoreductase RutF
VAVSSDEFRSALRRWTSGVSIVTVRGERGVQGITVASFCSLSLRPPLILICIDRGARSHSLIAEQGCFGVSILRSNQAWMSDVGAGLTDGDGRGLERLGIRTAITGAPILEKGLAWLDCRLVEQHEGGDHTIYIGRVEAAGYRDGSPLLWFMSGYGRLDERIPKGRSRKQGPRKTVRSSPAKRRRPPSGRNRSR